MKKTLLSFLSVLLVFVMMGSSVCAYVQPFETSIEQTEDSDETTDTSDSTSTQAEDSSGDSSDTGSNDGDSSDESLDEDTEEETNNQTSIAAGKTDSADSEDEDDEVETDSSDVDGYWIDGGNRVDSMTISGKTIRISTAKQLAWISFQVALGNYDGFSGYTIYLDANIDLSGHYWVPIGGHTISWSSMDGGFDQVSSVSTCTTSNRETYSFQGTFQGRGHTISNMVLSSSYTYSGLFGCIMNATINNFFLKGDSIVGESYVGAACGIAIAKNATCMITRIGNYCDVTANTEKAGGIVGFIYTYKPSGSTAQSLFSLYYCYNYGTVSISGSLSSAYAMCGGVVGAITLTDNNSTYYSSSKNVYVYIKDCFNFGVVTACDSLGGIVGYLNYACSNTSNWPFFSMKWCYNAGNVTAKSNNGGSSAVGGMIGYIRTSNVRGYATLWLVDLVNVGVVTTAGANSPSEFVGYINYGNCFNFGSSTSNSYSKIYHCYCLEDNYFSTRSLVFLGDSGIGGGIFINGSHVDLNNGTDLLNSSKTSSTSYLYASTLEDLGVSSVGELVNTIYSENSPYKSSGASTGLVWSSREGWLSSSGINGTYVDGDDDGSDTYASNIWVSNNSSVNGGYPFLRWAISQIEVKIYLYNSATGTFTENKGGSVAMSYNDEVDTSSSFSSSGFSYTDSTAKKSSSFTQIALIDGITLSATPSSAYGFLGYYKAQNVSSSYLLSSDTDYFVYSGVYGLSTVVSNYGSSSSPNVMIYAIFEIEIKFYHHDGTTDYDSPSSVAANDSFTACDAPTREGYTFVGWNKYESGSGDWYKPGDTMSIYSDGTTFYAQWVLDDNYWSNHIATAFDGGSGKSDNPYQISSAEQLAYMAYLVNNDSTYASKSYELIADIDLSSYYWVPIGLNNAFTGTFNGNGHTISGLTMRSVSPYDPHYWNGNSVYLGLFAQNDDGTIKNVIVKTRFNSGAIWVGTFSPRAVGSVGITDYSYAQKSSTYVGIAVADSYGGTISQVGALGGSSLKNDADSLSNAIRTTFDTSSIASSYALCVGGLCGIAESTTISSCFSSAAIATQNYCSYTYLGGLIGDDLYATISNCFSLYALTINTVYRGYAGGLAGRAFDSSISQCYAKGSITATTVDSTTYFGGFVGYMYSGEVANSFAVYDYSGSSTFSSLTNNGFAYTKGGTSYTKVGTYVTVYKFSSISDSAAQSASDFTSASAGVYTTAKVDSQKWSITSSASGITSYTWYVGNSNVCGGYPMLTWCLEYVEFSTNPTKLIVMSGTSVSTITLNMETSNSPNTDICSGATYSNTSSQTLTGVIFAGMKVEFKLKSYSSSLVFGQFLLDNEETGETSSTYTATSLSLSSTAVEKGYASSHKVEAKFDGIKVSITSYLWDSTLSTYSVTSSAGTVALSDTYVDFDSGTITVTPEIGYAVVGIGTNPNYSVCKGVTSSNSIYTVLDNTYDKSGNSVKNYLSSTGNYDGSINGLNLGTVTRKISSTYPFYQTDSYYTRTFAVLTVYFIPVVYEIEYEVTDVEEKTYTVKNYTTVLDERQSQVTLKGTTTNSTNEQDLYDVITNAKATHYYGVRWYFSRSTYYFEDLGDTDKINDVRDLNSSYAIWTYSPSSNTSYKFSKPLTLTAKAISYSLSSSLSSESSGNGTASTTGSVSITTTSSLKEKFGATASTNYYLHYVTTKANSGTYLDYEGSNSLGSGAIYQIITKYSIANIEAIANRTNVLSLTRSGGDYLTLVFNFAQGEYNLSLACNDENTSFSVSVDSEEVTLSSNSCKLSLGDTVTIGTSDTVNLYYGTSNSGKLLAYKSMSYAYAYSQKLTETNSTTWSTGNLCYSQSDVYTVNIYAETVESSTHAYSNAGSEPDCVNGVYQVTCAENLQWIAYQVANGQTFSGCKFVQTCDISMNGIDFVPIGCSANKYFAGTYDGGGYRIISLSITPSDSVAGTYVGLFGYAIGATIKNVTLDGGSVTGCGYVGALVGYAENCTFKNVTNYGCAVNAISESATITTSFSITTSVGNTGTFCKNGYSSSSTTDTTDTSGSYGSYFGGLVGYATTCTFSVCANNGGSLSGASLATYVSGLVGYAYGGTISQCYSSKVGGQLLALGTAIENNCYYYLAGSVKHYSYTSTSGSLITTTTAPSSSNCANYSTYWTTINGETVLSAFYW